MTDKHLRGWLVLPEVTIRADYICILRPHRHPEYAGTTLLEYKIPGTEFGHGTINVEMPYETLQRMVFDALEEIEQDKGVTTDDKAD